jgi:hypothetical protein
MTTTINAYLFVFPDWSEPVKIVHIWRTTMLIALDGSEQRAGLFSKKKRRITYLLKSLSYSETAKIKRRLFKYIHLTWGIPVWPDGTELSAQAASGQKVLNVDSTENRSFSVGGKVVVLGGHTNYEVGTIASKTATSITLEENLTNTWAKDTRVFPLLIGKSQSVQTMKMASGRYGTIAVEFESHEDGQTVTQSTTTASTTTASSTTSTTTT